MLALGGKPGQINFETESGREIGILPATAAHVLGRGAFPPTARVCMPRWNGTPGFTSGTCGGFATVCGNWD